MSNKFRSSMKIILYAGCISLVFLFGCDSLVPEKFKEKDYTINDLDKRAGDILASDTVNNSTGITIGYNESKVHLVNINSRTLASIVDTATRLNNTDYKIISMHFNSLVDSLDQLVNDSLMLVANPSVAEKDTTYAVLKVAAGQSRSIYLYVSLQYDGSNLNDYVSVNLIGADTLMANSTSNIPGEVVSGSTQLIYSGQQEHVIPVIRARYKIQLDRDVYLVRFIISSPNTTGPFKVLILPV